MDQKEQNRSCHIPASPKYYSIQPSYYLLKLCTIPCHLYKTSLLRLKMLPSFTKQEEEKGRPSCNLFTLMAQEKANE